MTLTPHHDAIVLVHRSHATWQVEGCNSPLFVCAEMFLTLRDIEVRRWEMWALRGEIAAAGPPVATLCEFLVAEDITWLEQEGARVAHGWHVDCNGTDPTVYRNVSLGRCTEYDAKARSIRLLKLSRCIERLHARHPDAAVFSDFETKSVEHRMLERLRVPVRRFGMAVDAGAVASAALPLAPSLSARLIALGRQGGLVAMRWLARWSARRQPPSTRRVVVRIGMQSALMLQLWLADRRHGLHFSLWMNYLMRPRSVLSLVLAGHSVTGEPSPAPPWSSHKLEGIGRAVRQLFRQTDRHVAAGPRLQPLLDEMLDELSRTSFPVALAAIDDAYAELGLPNSALLVIPNDCQLLMRAWTLVACQLGQASLVLQHGHLDYTEDGDHHTATHSAFWSSMIAHDYQLAGLRPEQLLVTGSPNADDHVRRQQAAQAAVRTKREARPRILIITTGNPGVQAYIGETWVCDYVAGILDALAPRFADFSIELKLHPGENADLYRRYLGARLPPGSEISDRGDLVQLIAVADIVISPPSTVIIEARAGGTAVILMPIPTVECRQTTLEQVDGVVTVRRCEALPATIDAMLSGRLSLPAGTWPLDRFLGPLDGQSSHRLIDAVDALARTPRGVAHPVPNATASASHAIH